MESHLRKKVSFAKTCHEIRRFVGVHISNRRQRLFQTHSNTSTRSNFHQLKHARRTACEFVWLMMKDYLVFFLLKLVFPWSLPPVFILSLPRYKKISEKIHTDKILGLFLESKTVDNIYAGKTPL